LWARSYARTAGWPIHARRGAAQTDGIDSAAPAPPRFNQEPPMLHYAVVFLVIALIAAVFGFGGIAAGAAGIAKVLFVVFLIMAVASFLFGAFGKR
jgi:uncharacterized membrane protein YtjA (UPF0391 family)